MLRTTSHRATILRRCSAPGRDIRRAVQTAARLKLAYDLHEPPKPQTSEKNAPILFLHGLFGSKKNNRAMSK